MSKLSPKNFLEMQDAHLWHDWHALHEKQVVMHGGKKTRQYAQTFATHFAASPLRFSEKKNKNKQKNLEEVK